MVIPTLNEAAHIQFLLEYLQRILNKCSYEIIVSDGGSRDQTRQLVMAFPEVILLTGPAGRGRQMNAGARASQGKWLYFLHADTFPPLDLHQQLQMAAESGLQSGCFSLRFDYQHPLLRFCSWCSKINWNCFRYGDQSLLVQRHVFLASGGYREDLEIMEGNDLVRRLGRRVNFSVLPAEVQTSARKYQRFGPFYLQLVYCIIYLLSRLGLAPSKLARLYRCLLLQERQQATASKK